MLHHQGADIAIVVSEVRAVERLTPSQIEIAPAHGRPRDLAATFLAGVTQIEGGIVMLLHLPHLLDKSAHPAQTAAPRFEAHPWTLAERAVLNERAARLRLYDGDEAHRGERAPVAILSLGGEEMGIELSVVREFASVGAVSPVPCCPPHILGQINLRGDIVTLVDVRAALGTARVTPPYFAGKAAGNGAANALPFVVVHYEGAPVGIVVDQVRDVLYLREDARIGLDISGQNGKFFSGGTLYQGRILPLLDVERLLAEGDLEVEERA